MRAPALLLLLACARGGRANWRSSIFFDELPDAAEDVESAIQPRTRVKRWLPNRRFSDPDNWEGGLVPCAGDRAVFPRSLGGAPAYVFTGRRKGPPVEVREMELPWSGVVILPAHGGSLVIGGEESRSRGCPGKDVRWRSAATPAWLDPANWSPAAPPRDPKDLAAVPHLERVPCGQDVASFADEAFQATLPDFPVRVAAVHVNGRLFIGGRAWLMTLVFREQLLRPLSWTSLAWPLQMMARSTDDVAGLPQQCGLGTHQGDEGGGGDAERLANAELEQSVCQHVTCPVPTCGRPVRPHLHCCFVCGAVLELRPLPADASEANEILGEVGRISQAEALRYEARWGADAGPAVHVGAVPAEGMAQVVLLGDNGQDLADIVLARVLAAGRWPGLATSVRASGAPMAPATAGSILAALLGSLLLVIVVLAVLVYFQDRTLPTTLSSLLGDKQSSFLFARFENAAGEEGAGGGAVSVVSRQPGVRSARGSWSSRSFRNPLFEQEEQQSPLGLPGLPGLPLQPAQPPPRGAAHENPLFSELKKRLDDNHGEAGAEMATTGADDPTAPTGFEASVEVVAEEVKLVDITL